MNINQYFDSSHTQATVLLFKHSYVLFYCIIELLFGLPLL